MQSNLYTITGGGLQPYQNPDMARTQPVVLAGGLTLAAGTVLGLVPGTGTAVNEVQTITITGTPTGGTFRLVFGDQMSPPIAYNASAATVQAALEALSNIGSGAVSCGGGALPGTAVTVTFQGALAGRNVPMLLTASVALTGGSSPAIAVTETTAGKPAGGYWDAYDDSASNGLQVARAILKDAATTGVDGRVTSLNGTLIGGGPVAATAYTRGTFLGSELTGLDANGLADLGGRVIAGIPGTLTADTTVILIP